MTLKKRFPCLAAGMLALIATCGLSGCGNEYKPDSSLHYFDNGDSYRVIELKSEQPEHIESYGLYAFVMPFAASPFESFDLTIDKESYRPGTLFFKDADAINRDGIEVVSACLNLSATNLADTATACMSTRLYTFTELIDSSRTSTTVSTGNLEGRYTAGFVADVDEYTFVYRDLSKKDGKEITAGEFTVLVNGPCWVDIFIPYAL